MPRIGVLPQIDDAPEAESISARERPTRSTNDHRVWLSILPESERASEREREREREGQTRRE